MKRIIKSKIFAFILGGLVLGSIGVYATNQYAASQITYKSTTVDKALDDLYLKQDTNDKYVIPKLSLNSAETSMVHGMIYLPNFNQYKTLSIEKATLSSGTFGYIKLISKDNELIHEFVLSNEQQSFDISNYEEDGFLIQLHSHGMGKYANMILENITLSK